MSFRNGIDPFTGLCEGSSNPFTRLDSPTACNTVIDNRDTNMLQIGDFSKEVQFLNGDRRIRIVSKKIADNDFRLQFEYYDDSSGEYISLLNLNTDGTRIDQVVGNFELFSQGAPGIISEVDTLSTSAEKFDQWIFRNLVDTPPSPTEYYFFSNTTTSASVIFTKPVVYELGVLNQTIPFITGLSMKVYQNDSDPVSLTGTVSYSTNESAVAGNGTQFTTEIDVGDAITIESSSLTGTVTKTEDSNIVTGNGTQFTSELVPNVILNISGEKRRIVSISSDNQLVCDTSFSNTGDSTTATFSETRVVLSIASDTQITVDTPFHHSQTDRTRFIRILPNNYRKQFDIRQLNE